MTANFGISDKKRPKTSGIPFYKVNEPLKSLE